MEKKNVTANIDIRFLRNKFILPKRMDLSARKIHLINYLRNGISAVHFTNGMQGSQLGFKSYNEFLEFQKQIVNQFNENSIKTLETIRDELVPITKVIDRTNLNHYPAAGFIFDAVGNIIYYDARK
jgi:hypothetical protein